MAKYYNVSLDYLAGLTDVKTNSSVSAVSESKQALINAIENMTEDEKKLLLILLQKLIHALK